MSTSRVYAEGTTVEVSKSRAEIDLLLTKNGATTTAILNDDEKHLAAVAFTMKGARFRIEIPLPTIEDVRKESRRRRRIDLAQLSRERWRQVLLMLRAKLEVVRIGLSTVEHEFMADLVLPNGQTAHHALADALRRGLAAGELPNRMLSTGEGS